MWLILVLLSVARAEYGFSPRQSVLFDIDKFEQREAGLETMLAATARLLALDAGDAVLLYEAEDPILRRHAGQVLLSHSPFWTQERRGLFLDEP